MTWMQWRGLNAHFVRGHEVRLYTNRGASLGTYDVSSSLVAAAESMIDGTAVEYLDILAWTPTHEAVVRRFVALEAECAASASAARP